MDDLQSIQLDCDFVRFTVCDIHGNARCKSVPASMAMQCVRGNRTVSAYAGIVPYGTRSELIDIPEVISAGLGNVILLPDISTYHRLPWATNGRFRVGELICEPCWSVTEPQEGSPRVAARHQLNRLSQLGFTLRSAFECEYTVVDSATKKPVPPGNDIFSSFILSQNEAVLYELGTQLKESGVLVETYEIEYSPGQFELTISPELGIRAADVTFQFKDAVKEFYHAKGYDATFMAKPFSHCTTSGFHFNFSILDGSGNKVFTDKSTDTGMSVILRHWLGGLLTHARAITALSAPTVNCYRRFLGAWSPKVNTWGIDDRTCACRVKSENKEDIYVEMRIPSAAANPYLVLAAVVAAGIDGIEKKIDCDDVTRQPLPANLQEALTCLEQDVVLTQALGQQLISWFVKVKREVELVKLKDVNLQENDETVFELEREMYFSFV